MMKFINNYAARPEDSVERQFQKKLIFIVAISCCLCGIVWSGLCYFVYDGGLPMILPLCFVLIVGIAIVLGSKLKSYLIPVYTQLSCITFITALIQWSIGSLHDSGIVMTWTFFGPIGALLFLSRKGALVWLGIFFSLILITIFAQPHIGNLSPEVTAHERTLLYVMNLLFPMALIFWASLYLFDSMKKLKRQNDELLDKTQEKNQEIRDSMNYAKRIQKAILPQSKVVKEHLNDSFILYKPKDIVAGDFYWLEHVNNKVLFAAADCTGHGVPGAMVSVICNNGLNRSVKECGLSDPGQILDKTRDIVISEFEKSEDEVKDGMDVALCSLEGNILQYAGAHNPLWLIRNGELIETKANKQPIGKFDNLLPYKTHSFELEKGDTFYIFSDGYSDQFGGEKGKKYKSGNFKKFLLSIQEYSMEKQHNLLDEEFEKWRGKIEQIDDVCVVGVRV